MTNVSSLAERRTSVESMADSCIDLHNVSVRFSGRDVLQAITWQVQPAERWVILGRNGCGKTTLLRTVSMYHHPTTGSVRILGELWGRTDVRELRKQIGLVSSSLADLIRPDLCAFDVVLTARHGALETWWHSYSDEDRQRASAEMERMQVGHLANHSFVSLSSGERQRVQMARMLMAQPSLMLFDEPAAGLDLTAREELLDRMSVLARNEAAAPLVLVTHHLEEIPLGFTHAMLLHEGRQLAAGPLEQVLTSQHLSTCFEVPLEVSERAGRWSAVLGPTN